jgi:hypothetical protein
MLEDSFKYYKGC